MALKFSYFFGTLRPARRIVNRKCQGRDLYGISESGCGFLLCGFGSSLFSLFCSLQTGERSGGTAPRIPPRYLFSGTYRL